MNRHHLYPLCRGLGRAHTVQRCSHQPSRTPRSGLTPPGAVDVTVIEVAAHTAYLEPRTGTGLLILPDPEAELPTEDQVTEELDQLGWSLFEDEAGRIEIAGRTTDGRLAVCLCGDEGLSSQPTLSDIHHALIALRIAADLDPD